MKEIDKMAEEYLNNVRGMSTEKRSDHLDSIQKLFSKSREFGDDKVSLAMQTYEMVCVVLKLKHFIAAVVNTCIFEICIKSTYLVYISV